MPCPWFGEKLKDIAVLLVLLYPVAIAAEVTLVSSVEQNGRTAACPGELVTFTCTVTQGVSLNWASTAFTSCNSTPTYLLEVNTSVSSISICGSFQANLTAITNNIQMQGSLQADLTSTLSPNIAVSPGTMVTCSDLIVGSSLSKSYPNIASLPSPPQSPTTTVQIGPDNITVVVQWDYPLRDGGAPVDNYTVTLVGPGAVHLSTTTVVHRRATFTLAYNEEYTVSIAATNCVGTGGTVSLNVSEANCGAPPPPVSGSMLQPYTNTTEGSVVVFQCGPGFVPEGVMTAVCGSDGQWTPNPGGVTCSPRPTPTSTQLFTEASILTPSSIPGPGSNEGSNICTSCSTSIAITAVVSCAVSFIIGALVGAVVYYCTMRKKSNCQKCYSLTVAHKQQQQQQPAPVYEDVIGQSQNIELKENVAYGPVQQ